MKKYLLALLGVMLLLIFSGCSDKSDKKIVAFISLSNVDNNTFNGFKMKMEELGWKENTNIEYIVAGAAQSVQNLPNKVKTIMSKKPDMILVASTPATQEVKKQNKNIPVIFCPVNDPVGSQILQNSNRPEGDITGVRLPVGDHKRTEWLYQIAPNIKNVFVPFTPKDKSSKVSRDNIQTIAKELGFNIIENALEDESKIDQFIKNIPDNIDAIILPRDSIIESKIEKFVNYSIKNKIPLSVPSYQHVQKGGLYTYGFIHKELGKDAAKMADKILKGVNVKDLPVKFGAAYLVLNKKTAKQIGIKFNNDILSNAKLIIKE